MSAWSNVIYMLSETHTDLHRNYTVVFKLSSWMRLFFVFECAKQELILLFCQSFRFCS